MRLSPEPLLDCPSGIKRWGQSQVPESTTDSKIISLWCSIESRPAPANIRQLWHLTLTPKIPSDTTVYVDADGKETASDTAETDIWWKIGGEWKVVHIDYHAID